MCPCSSFKPFSLYPCSEAIADTPKLNRSLNSFLCIFQQLEQTQLLLPD